MKSLSRFWLFRLLAIALGPLLFVVAAEGVLRVAGYGHPTSFFLPVPGTETEATNPRFGYRFFGPRLARAPVLETLGTHKQEDEYRIFVLGGSAAMGTPDASFGVAKILEVLLAESFPERRFVVINAAMAAVNSHVVVEIARECAARQGDLFLVYLGNNEVVGPFGPGTVFGRFSPSPTLVRLNLLAKKLRLTQLLEAALRRIGSSGGRPPRWRGMEMFVDNEIAADDPRLEATYRHFERNLSAIARLAREAGAEIVLSTVATNLKDSPPFASADSTELGERGLSRLEELRERAVAELGRGDSGAAIAVLEEAAALDPNSAETRFLLGTALFGTGHPAARDELVRARDLDRLRFRADSRINEVVRQVAAREQIVLLDAETLLERTPEARGRPLGRELFHEHVHLNFAGNYRLARAFLDSIAELLPHRQVAQIPGAARIAERLALTAEDSWRMQSAMNQLMSRPPFSAQLGHAERSARHASVTRRLRAARVAERDTTERIYREAVAARPEDTALRARYAELLSSRGEAQRAEEQWRRLLSRVPTARSWRTGLAFALADQGRFDVARRELEAVARSYPEFPESTTNLATVLERLGRTAEAEDLYRRTVARSPDFEAAALNLARLLEARGQTEEAERIYRSASDRFPHSAEGPFRLASYFDRAANDSDAEEWYSRAIERDPTLALAHNNLGFLMERDGRLEAAAKAYGRAIQEDPALALAYFNLADLLLQVGRPEEAAPVYRAGLALAPDNEQARKNLARAAALL